jgi:phosphohistidine phosphatase
MTVTSDSQDLAERCRPLRVETAGQSLNPMLFLVHHADAVGPEIDPQRPLSSVGRQHAERLALDAVRRGVKPIAIWHSGKLRARQTADAFWRACNPLAELAAIRGLQPTDPPDWIRDRVAGETRDLMLVGHFPNLPRVLHVLVTGRQDENAPDFPVHGLVALEADGDRWIEQWRIDGSSA